jgi:hypothetical protein
MWLYESDVTGFITAANPNQKAPILDGLSIIRLISGKIRL